MLCREKAFLYRLAFHKLKRLFFFARRRLFLPSHNLLSAKEYGHSFDDRSNSLRCNTRTSHRFKAFSPPFCAKNRFRHVPLESFSKSISGRALNRGRRTESRVLFGYFLHDAKSDKPYSLAGSSEVLRTSNQHTKQQLRTSPIKSFRRPWRHFLLLPQQFLPLRGISPAAKPPL